MTGSELITLIQTLGAEKMPVVVKKTEKEELAVACYINKGTNVDTLVITTEFVQH